MINLLIITMAFPYPLKAGGKIRVYNLIKRLSGSCNITLLSLATREEDRFVPELQKFCKKVVTVPIAERGVDRLLHFLRCLCLMGRRMSAEMALKEYYAFHRALEGMLSHEAFDIIQVEFAQMLPYILGNKLRASASQVMWVEHEILHHRYFKRSESDKGIQRWFWQREAQLIRDCEIDAARRLQYAIAVSEEEGAFLRTWNPELNVAIIPNGVDVSFYDEIIVEREPRSIIFTGWMRHYPNLDAAYFLLKEVMPLIIQKMPDARLYLVGEPIPDRIRSMAMEFPQITLTGYVDDIRPLVKRASVAIVPLRVGGGTHLKVLEAMAARTPLVTTPVGAEGLPLKHRQHAWISKDASGLAEGVMQLLNDKKLQASIVSEARNLVEKEFDWAIITGKQMTFYRQVLNI